MLVLPYSMKKFIAIPLLVLYLTAVSGMMIQIHFCGTKLSAWNVNKEKASCCCEESGKEPKEQKVAGKADDCCSDKTITLKIGQDQNKVNDVQLQLNALQVVPLPAVVFPQFEFALSNNPQASYQANAPPGLWQSIPLYKLHSRLTYYG